jgi:hypothetical protein
MFLGLLLLLSALHCEFPKEIHRLSECIIATAATASWLRLLDVRAIVINLIARSFSRSLVLFNSLK